MKIETGMTTIKKLGGNWIANVSGGGGEIEALREMANVAVSESKLRAAIKESANLSPETKKSALAAFKDALNEFHGVLSANHEEEHTVTVRNAGEKLAIAATLHNVRLKSEGGKPLSGLRLSEKTGMYSMQYKKATAESKAVSAACERGFAIGRDEVRKEIAASGKVIVDGVEYIPASKSE